MNEPKEHRISKIQVPAEYDTWFISEVDKDLASAGRGELTDHGAVRAMIDRRYPALPSAKDAQHT